MAWVQIRLNSTDKQAEQISDFLEEIVGKYRCSRFI